MNFNLKIIIFSIIALFAVSFLQSQENTSEKLYCFKYGLQTGDTLYYRVVSYDSIIIDFSEPLLKTRYERIKVSVDSVINEKIFLTQELTQFIGKESKGDIKNITRESSPWLGQKVQIVIDSLGNRYDQNAINPSGAKIHPGGAFMPYLFFSIKESCKFKNESWLVKSTDTLAENSFPYPILNQTSMMRVVGDNDTLGYEGKKFRFIKTAQGFYYLFSKNDTTEIFARINSGGYITFTDSTNIPLHYFSTIEQKLKITDSKGNETPGWHFISSDFTLDKFIRKDTNDTD